MIALSAPLQEIKELESQVQNETVVLQDNGSRSLDMDKIIESFNNQYANMAARSREDVEYWNKKKVSKRTRDLTETSDTSSVTDVPLPDGHHGLRRRTA